MNEKSGHCVGQTHYEYANPQPIEIMQSVLSPEEFVGFLKGNILKYRLRTKSPEDLAKAEQYFTWLQQVKAGETINPRE